MICLPSCRMHKPDLGDTKEKRCMSLYDQKFTPHKGGDISGAMHPWNVLL